ncbi:BREX system serine/threonine kinase PglW [Gloeobacter morelensis MG652769]|uniref:BREX system serine/threonine kinase PglW n=2 Tax=Gloeobacter TaxID=33071 RepID=A0ABY3PJ23_9CYAN|nr:BREX system serine/threonine kinase PglW [Gloeobacter morelensis]UFP93619.1 BREX system serine/threonine kinase PglW [Gloeobacter morelensis MG652769]
MNAPSNWKTITESRFPWEQDALEFVRGLFPKEEPYQAWSNFEFIATDGTINEVDLLVFGPQGFFLIEIKSHPGRLFGDAGTWMWEYNGKRRIIDNPLNVTNLKAKKLRSLLERQNAFKSKVKFPFLEALIFCSAPDLRLELQGIARFRVCQRDREPERGMPGQAGIIAAITRRECPGVDPQPRGSFDRSTARAVCQAMEQAGIRPTQRYRQVGDYQLEHVIGEGPNYQDWQATHVQLDGIKRQVRLYPVGRQTSQEARSSIERAAQREFQILETLQHPGILRTFDFTQHELGPALILEHHPQAIRLDHFLAQRKGALGIDLRLDLMRQIAEAVRYAHDKKAVHRGLCPQSILVVDPDRSPLQVKIFNWQIGYRNAASISAEGRRVSPTFHVDGLVDNLSTAYMAPEAMADESGIGEHLDVFSLGAIAFHLFSDEAPAANGLELSNKLRESKGLQISSVLNGAGQNLQDLVRWCTHPDVGMRLGSVNDFLELLGTVEDELTTPEQHFIEDPNQAQTGDVLPGNFTVRRRLGKGSYSVVLLAELHGQQFVLKVANDPEHNSRLQDEAEVLQKLRHPHIVEFCGTVEIAGRTAFLMRPVLVDRDELRIETLAQRLRNEGRLLIDLLQRFGEDLLSVVDYLEEQGIPHRDIKPENIVVGQIGRGDRLHLVLFDFSLSRSPIDNIRAGTPGYLDPLLCLRKPPRWDLHAERYAAAVTLYELATGTLPKWGDGLTDPSYLDCEITIEAELFDANLRDSLVEFFTKALRRDPAQRFDNAEQMLRAWRGCFEGIELPGALVENDSEELLRALLAGAKAETKIAELGLGTRAVTALDRENVLSVADLLAEPPQKLAQLRGVGNKTRREISTVLRILREQLGSVQIPEAPSQSQPGIIDPGKISVDILGRRIAASQYGDGTLERRMLSALLGLDPELDEVWPSQADLARHLDVTPAWISQLVHKLQSRWAKEPAFTRLREDLLELLKGSGGAMTIRELAEIILLARGSALSEPRRTQQAISVLRAAVEIERAMHQPRFVLRREKQQVLLALTQDLADYALQLGNAADRIADEDPLVPPARTLQLLRNVAPPAGAELLSDIRLVRLAASASQHSALSSRQELYPRGMGAARALKLSQGALYGLGSLGIEQIRERVKSRYPEAAPLPERPVLDDLLIEAGLELRWESAAEGSGGYVGRLLEASTDRSITRQLTANGQSEAITPEMTDAWQFEERLRRGVREGVFLALLVDPRHYQQACRELSRRFAVELVELEGAFIDALRQVAEQSKVDWDLVVRTDAAPRQGDWDKLMLLVGRAMPLVEQQLARAERTILLTYTGILARYDQIGLIERLRDRVGRTGGIPGLWVLIPGDQQAVIGGKPVPLISPGQRVRIPESWLGNRHRATQKMGAPSR